MSAAHKLLGEYGTFNSREDVKLLLVELSARSLSQRSAACQREQGAVICAVVGARNTLLIAVGLSSAGSWM